MRVRFPYAARYDSMPVGSSRRCSHDHAGRSDGPRFRLFGGHKAHRQRSSSYEWMMRTALCRKGWCESDKAYPPMRERFPGTWATAFLVKPTHRMSKRSGTWGFSPRDPCHASCGVLRVHRKHECRIWHEWSNPQWTARACPCGLPANAFVAQPVEATVQGTVRSGFEPRRKHQRKQRRQRHPIRFERLPERERCHGRFSS